MSIASYCRLGVLLALSVSRGQQAPQEPLSVTFHEHARLVLLSFHVIHGANYVTDLKSSDVSLLEDGNRRDFTIFESPATQGRMPLELVLLFDANPKIEYFWDPAAVFRFIPQWDEGRSKAVLEKGDADLRISVYHCADRRLHRLSRATTDPQQILSAFRRILTPQLPALGPGGSVELTLPAKRDQVDPGPFTTEFQTSPFVSAGFRGWPLEAAIATLKEAASAPDKVARMLIMFSEGIGATTTEPEDVGNQALDLGIPIYPIVTNYQQPFSKKPVPNAPICSFGKNDGWSRYGAHRYRRGDADQDSGAYNERWILSIRSGIRAVHDGHAKGTQARNQASVEIRQNSTRRQEKSKLLKPV